MRAVADLADLGQVRARRSSCSANAWFSPMIGCSMLPSLAGACPRRSGDDDAIAVEPGRAGCANEIIQDGLRSEGTLTGEGRVLTVRERVNVAHEALRYAHFWKDARILEVAHPRNSLGLDRGDYRIERIYANGRIGLRDERGRRNRIDPAKFDPMNRRDGLQLKNDKTIRVHEGETIRWTANDKAARCGTRPSRG
ncbi:hypothetical protein KRR38_33745 [Novosphingobium sp. G106]|uniref:hypothetical protein n=1 Tax=Novosphingobium sp. G106 TaxID=2849500 RepID=UPI001C2CCC81|nr:hypothetical protein [Novosphingobium sp. G106]MBV1692467.1 hypothetical protein [Novosphingobium sp. G106]